jgi:CHAD domain-containing protein
VGVATAAGVAFGCDEHMLAESGQQMTTDRTAIRRRLAVRRTAHRPPWGARKAGHRSIVAPLAATIAATVAVGVGVALARAGRDRRESHRDGANERQFALLPGERLADGMVRMALGQVDLALELLGGGGGALDEHAVHEIRKALKRLRALLRLLEEELGAKTYARENAALRKTAARLAGARDAEVMLATLERLIARHPRKLRRRGGVVRLRAQLAAEHERMERHTLGDEATRALVLEELRAFRARVLEWQLRDRDGVRLVEPGLAGVYRQGRRRYRRAAHARRDRVRAMHEWRKRVKDLRYAAEMLQRRDPARRAGLGAPAGSTVRAPGHGAGREAARLRRLAKRADALGEMLGEEHDLALLAELIGAQRRSGKGKRSGRSAALRPRIGRRTRKLLLKLIARRRRRLRKRALHEGERLYAAGPKRFLRGVRAAYASGWQSAS